MDGIEKRGAERVQCQIPLGLKCAGVWQSAVAVDVSRTGVRLHLPLEALELGERASILTLARRLCEVLPKSAPAQFDPERLGALVARRLEVMRIGLSSGPDTRVELACRFDLPLSNIDAAALRVEIPDPEPLETGHADRADRVGPHDAPWDDGSVSAEPALIDMPPSDPGTGAPPALHGVVEPRARRPGRRFRVYLSPTTGQRRRSALAWTESIDAQGLVVLIPKRESLGLPPDADDVRTVLLALCETFGSRLTLKIMDGAKHVWVGLAEIRAAETLPSNSSALLLELAFERPLRASEMRALAVR